MGVAALRIWIGEIFSATSQLDGYMRAAMRREVATVLRLRLRTSCVDYHHYIQLASGFVTVLALGDDIYFRYHADPTDPVPPLPPLNSWISVLICTTLLFLDLLLLVAQMKE